MEEEIEKKIKNLKEFIKQKTDQGTANYLSKEVRELCGMVETQALSQHDVSRRLFLVTFLGKDELGEIVKGIEVMAHSSEDAMNLIKEISMSREIYSAIDV